jgi:hypothetical protein
MEMSGHITESYNTRDETNFKSRKSLPVHFSQGSDGRLRCCPPLYQYICVNSRPQQ